MKSKSLLIIISIVVIILLIPFVAMQFSDEVAWDIHDFSIMGILLLGTGLLCELTIRRLKSLKHRIIICVILLFTFFLIWAELAVGIFGTPFAGS